LGPKPKPADYARLRCRDLLATGRANADAMVSISNGHGVVVIGPATCLILPRSGGTSPAAPRGSHDAEA
jgi:hypothetical protein